MTKTTTDYVNHPDKKVKILDGNPCIRTNDPPPSCFENATVVFAPWSRSCFGRVQDTTYDDLGYHCTVAIGFRANVKSLGIMGPEKVKLRKCIVEDDDCNGVSSPWSGCDREVIDHGCTGFCGNGHYSMRPNVKL